MSSQIQIFGVHRILVKPHKHVYPGGHNAGNFTVLRLELFDVKGNSIPTVVSLYSAEQQSEVSFAPAEITEHN